MNTDLLLTSSTVSPSSTLALSDMSFDNSTICADQLVGDLLEGTSGKIIWGILQLLLTILGNIGNILTLIVLNHRLMRKGGINNLLQGLAISDIVAPTLACLPNVIYYHGPKNHIGLITFLNAYIMPIATGATFCSNWIVVTITGFRLMIVVKPLYSQVYCSSRNERKSLLIIFIFSILSIIPYYYYRSHSDAQIILKVISAIVSLLCPWVICVLLWILLIRIVNREIGTERSKEFILHSEIIAQRLKSKSKMTKMVLIICFFNIICQLPVLILTIFGLFHGNPCGYLRAFAFVGLFFLSNLLLIVNHSINFFIYSLTNCKFRYTLKIMTRHCWFCSHYHSNHSKTTRQTILFDEQRKLHLQKPMIHKFDNSSCITSRGDRENPHLLINVRLNNSTKLHHNLSTRIAL